MESKLVQIGRGAATDFKLLGSGHLIGPGLVLTALHVVCPNLPQDGWPAGDAPNVDVRVFADFGGAAQDMTTYPATLAWPNWPPDFPDGLRYDLAVLKVAGPLTPGFRQESVALRDLGRGDVDEVKKYCRGFGFPSFVALNGRYPALGVDGILDVLNYYEFMPNDLIYMVTSNDNAAPKEKEGWKGASGAALYDETGVVVGVLNTVRESLSNNLFYCTTLPPRRVEKKVDPLRFWEVVGKPVTSAPAVVSRPIIRPEEFVTLIDRAPHDDIVRNGYEARLGDEPAVVLFHSRTVDDPASFAGRYSSGALDFDISNGVRQEVPLIEWVAVPPADPGKALQRLLERLLKLAATDLGVANQQGSTLSPASPPEDFKHYFASDLLPHAFQTRLEPEYVDDPQHMRLLDDFVAFFAKAGQSPKLNCLFIGLTYDPEDANGTVLKRTADPLDKTAANAWAKLKDHLENRTDVLVWTLGALTEVSQADVELWRQRFKQASGLEIDPRFLERLRGELVSPKPLIKVREIVRRLQRDFP